MRLKLWVAILMFLSSYSPLVLILAARDFNYQTLSVTTPDVVLPALLIAAISCVILMVVMRQFRGGEFATVQSTDNRSIELFNYTIPYLISFLSLNIGAINDLIAFGLFMLLMFGLTYKTDNLYINPVLTFMGYGLYHLTVTISGQSYQVNALLKKRPEQGSEYFLEKITPFLYVQSSRKR